MGLSTAPRRVAPRVPLRHGEGGKDHLTSFGGLAALSLDALSSVAYGPEAMLLVLVGAGSSALHLSLPIALAIAESARFLMLPMVVFVCAIFGVIVVGVVRAHPAAVVGAAAPIRITESLGVLLVLKAFAAGCSALTGIEAIANGVPSFREPRAQRAQRTELVLGVLLGPMLIGLAVLVVREHIAPRTGVTVLAQATAGSFGDGWAYSATNILVALVLALAANTSFGGLPVLMSLLARDHRLPHLFALRAERPVYRVGVLVLASLAAVLLIAVDAATSRLIPLYAIGVFIGFTISQAGLLRHWYRQRPRGWARRAVLNGTGAFLTAIAAIVFVATKFTEGAWLVVIAVPALMLLFARVQSYYRVVGSELGLGIVPGRPHATRSLVIVPVGEISRLTEYALTAALSLGDEVVAVSIHLESERSARFRDAWDQWNPGVRLEIVESPHRSLVHPILAYVRRAQQDGRQIAVLIPEVEPRARRYRILQNQRGLLLATVLRARTDVLVCTLPYRLTSR
ncbi:amino acid permease [Actinospica robiniae]|uniref:amino acid permease n=1 Tax=Actinospica robiniae TaxID=304901 RepID=UPI00041505B9|nr:amino acid permease [Actinospica robiniae]